MNHLKKIESALISVFHKDNLAPIIEKLHANNVKLYSTGGTQKFISELGIPVTAVEDLTGFPAILGGRVKTLHPKIFGGILARREDIGDSNTLSEMQIPNIDLVIVDLYPFSETLASGAIEQDVIEKIDIGGISLIRAAAKNFKDVLIIPSQIEYKFLLDILDNDAGSSSVNQRKLMAGKAFALSSQYDEEIRDFFISINNGNGSKIKKSTTRPSFMKNYNFETSKEKVLRYGENPHQTGKFFGELEEMFEQLHGKELSYNNLVDADAAVQLIADFDEPTFAIIKHTNACGLASATDLKTAYNNALAGDPVSAFGGVLICNKKMDSDTAEVVNNLFFEILIAPDFDEAALTILKVRKNRMLLKQKLFQIPEAEFKTLLNGVLVQDKDLKKESAQDLKCVTENLVSEEQMKALLFANKIVKHTKSNTIVLTSNNQLIASGVGQTSRVDALRQAIDKAGRFGLKLEGAVMASDAFFPFPDCVEIAAAAGIKAIVQPGGSIKDADSINACNRLKVAMAFTGNRHFKH